MAYAAVISLKNTFERLVTSSRISLSPSSRKIIGLAYKELVLLQQTLINLKKSQNKSERMKALEARMRDEVYKLEDLIESQIVSLSECIGGESSSLTLTLDVEDLRQDIDRFRKKAKKMANKCAKELRTSLPGYEDEDEDEDEDEVPSRIELGGKKSKMVGLSDKFVEMRDRVLDEAYYIKALALVGMAGIGKTILAEQILEDPLITRSFECHAFVRIGQKSLLKRILHEILEQVGSESDKKLLEGHEELYECLWRNLYGRRYLIVLDDVWSTDFCEDLLKRLPQENNGSKVLVTTRLEHVALHISTCRTVDMRFLNEEESWDLLRENVFGNESIDYLLEKAGRKIAENCEGLPLLILAVAELLSKAEKTLEYWNEVADDKENPIFMDAYEKISKVLYPSFNYLPEQLKSCFLYMAAFPRSYEIGRRRIGNMWGAEGFLEPKISQSIEEFALECFERLLSCNVVVIRKQSLYRGRVKACSLHFVYWIMCRKEARNQSFLHTLKRYGDGVAEGIESQRRLAIYNNTLFSIKYIEPDPLLHSPAESIIASKVSISAVRSLLCTGAYHPYQVPLCSGLRLLRVLDALTIRFYEFPIEVLKLVQLRYLAVTCNKNLPPSISKLWKLQYLILHQHLSIKSTSFESYLPVETWDLQELKSLEIPGRNLPDPNGAILPNLIELLDVSAHSCTKRVLESIPNLNKLRLQIELSPNSKESVSYIDHISHFIKLKSLKCVVVNPVMTSEVVLPHLPPLPSISHSLKRLTLSGFGYPWNYMSKLAKLPVLTVLKLQCYAFRGEKWEAEEDQFSKLRYLSIEDTDLVQWTVGDETFPFLWFLSMKNCYKLRVMPNISSLMRVVQEDCNTSAMASAKQINTSCRRIDAYSSWNDGKLKK